MWQLMDRREHNSLTLYTCVLQVAFLIRSLFNTPLNNLSQEHVFLACPLMIFPNGEINGIK